LGWGDIFHLSPFFRYFLTITGYETKK